MLVYAETSLSMKQSAGHLYGGERGLEIMGPECPTQRVDRSAGAEIGDAFQCC